MFVIWGASHGLALAVHRLWSGLGMQMSRYLAWPITFVFINATWVFFRAKTWTDAKRVFEGMIDFGSILNASSTMIATSKLAWAGPLADYALSAMPASIAANIVIFIPIIIGFVVCTQPNSVELMKGVESNWKRLSFGLVLFITGMLTTFMSSSTVFLYFNF
jgi:alginate O-acetyltransferase complex protein AlgI